MADDVPPPDAAPAPGLAFHDKLRAWSYVLLGAGFMLSAVDLLSSKKQSPAHPLGGTEPRRVPRGNNQLRLIGGSKAPRGGAPSQSAKTSYHDVGNIDARAALIVRLAKKGSINGKLHETTTQILAHKSPDGKGGLKWSVPEKDAWAEARWVFNAIRNPNSPFAVRYTRDMLLADTFTAAERTALKTHGGDCDDYAVLLAAMLMSVGHAVRLRIVQERGAPSWSHIYVVTPDAFPGTPQFANAKWYALDASVNKPPGWEVEGAADVARTGQPAGRIEKVKDVKIAA